MANLLARTLYNLFFGQTGQTNTIQNANQSPPTDYEIVKTWAKASLQPLYWIGNLDFTSPLVVNSVAVNQISESNIAWERIATGTFTGTLAGAFKGIFFERIYVTGANQTIKVVKTSDDIITVSVKNAGGTSIDTVTNYKLVLELIPI